jgi:pilus assembly protein CpaC
MEVSSQKRRSVRRTIGALIFIVAIMGWSTLLAQVPTPVLTASAARDSAPPVEPGTDSVRLLVGRSTIVNVGKPIARVSLTSADIADALVTSPTELLINGKAAGTISMFVWDRAGAIRRYEVVVQRDLARLSAQLKELFPKESIDVRANGRTAVLSGIVSSKDVADKMASLAGSFVDSKEELVSLLQVGPAGRSNQVLLRVRFAEVSRSALTQLGSSFFTGAGGYKGEGNVGQVATQQFPVPFYNEFTKGAAPPGDGPSKQTFSDFLNLFFFNNKYNIGTVITALQNQGLFQSLAEPNLVAESGKEASFLAGGEFPVPIAQASGGGTSISVQFKEFGIRLTFTPTVNGDRVHLKVRPEVSTLDFSNAVTLGGFRIPALSTRRTETEVELNNGQTFAIAGLMNNTMNSTLSKIPGIGDIPILGLLFKSKAAQKNQTELVVMITPEILQNDSPGVTPNLPKLVEPFMPPVTLKKDVPVPAPAFRADDAQPAAPVAAVKPSPEVKPTPTDKKTPTPAAAAAMLKANSPATRTIVRTPASEPAKPLTSQVAPTSTESAPAATTSRPASASESTTPAAAVPETRSVSAAERKAAERADKEQRKRDELEARAMAAEAQRRAKQADVDARKQKEVDARLEKVNRAQAQRDAEAARRAEELAKKQAEIDQKHEKEIADAQNRLKAAQAAYQDEVSKLQSR